MTRRLEKHEFEPGELRHLVQIWGPADPSTNQDGYGQPKGTEGNLYSGVTIHAGIEAIGGREVWHSQQVQPDVTHGVTLRYRSGLTPKMRIVFQGRALEIVSIYDVEERKRKLRLQCIEQPTGT